MKNIAFLLLFGCLSFSCSNLYNLSEARVNHKKYGFIDNYSFCYRENPISNREYLIFLCWNIETYSESYPEFVKSLFPEKVADLKTTIDSDFGAYFKTPTGIFKDYILNPYYLDYPVTGLTEESLKALYKFLNDRYNENLLIDIGHLNFNPNQKDEDTFSLEAFLSNQFVGDVRKNIKPIWKDNIFLPLFRPPYESENSYYQKIIYRGRLSSPWRAFKMTKRNFLWRWNERYILSDKDFLELRLGQKTIIVNKESNQNKQYKLSSFYVLDDINNEFSDCKYFDEGPSQEKDKFGHMPFVVIGQNTNGRPIIKKVIDYLSSYSPSWTMYQITYNKHIDFKYWP